MRFREHSIRMHLLTPLWSRIPEKRRWSIVHFLNKSDRFCWSNLVDAALYPKDGDDPCDSKLPLPSDAPACASICGWMGDDHRGEHACGCYCGKFRFFTGEGFADRKEKLR